MSDIICFDKGGREWRRTLVDQGRAPRDFFYGVIDLQQRGYQIDQLSSATPYVGRFAWLFRAAEVVLSRLNGLGLRTHYLDQIQESMSRARVAVSFTDGFSLTLGHYYRRRHKDTPTLVGCFHRLSDLETKTKSWIRPLVHRIIRRSLNRLDHVAFFGPADREFGIKRYGLDRAKTSIILFGVDTEFWKPSVVPVEDFLFAVGQDPSRDFDTLVAADLDVQVRIHTSLRVAVPPSRTNLIVTSGSYHKSTLTEEELRDLYHRSIAVVVPLKDVYQPTGYSVTLQAMACGKPVILSRIRGLWAPELLRDGENCLLVSPGDSHALAATVSRLIADTNLQRRLSINARQTVLDHFSTGAASLSLESLLQHAL